MNPSILPAASFFGYLIGAVASAMAALWMMQRGDRARSDRLAAILAATLTGIWCALAAALEPRAPVVALAETARNLALVFLLFRLFGNDGRDESIRVVRPVVFSLGFVTLLQPALLGLSLRPTVSPGAADLIFRSAALLQMLAAIGALMLLHNLYAGASTTSRLLLRWSAAALVGIWAFDLNLFTIAYMSDKVPAILLAMRGLITGLLVGLLAVGSNSAAAGLQFSPSRAVTFQTLSLLVIGAYLLVMLFVVQSLPVMGGDFGRIAQVGFLLIASVAAAVWLPSRSTRGWLRVTAAKHLFRHRYDYRNEWLRFTRTIGRASPGGESLQERAIRAMADITDSPAGLLLTPNEEAELELVARWNWAQAEVPAVAAKHQLSGFLEQEGYIVDLDELRGGERAHFELENVPQWLLDEARAWALVPLLHFDRLVGVVVLARPGIGRKLDWEDFDMLRVVGQQLASYLAEQTGQRALMEASRFDEFNRRIAFVMHDIKNLASQLSLLARNAEKHADNPDFRADMLVTLRNSADKLNALLARLGRYGGGEVHKRATLDLQELAQGLVARFGTVHPVRLVRDKTCLVQADAEALEQALVHLLQNAIDASEAENPVSIDVGQDRQHGCIEIADSGVGMSAGFVRDGLFKPFVSSKNGGFGIGAFEARELIRAMGGRLGVESREGIGTRFIISLPLADAGSANTQSPDQSEVA